MDESDPTYPGVLYQPSSSSTRHTAKRLGRLSAKAEDPPAFEVPTITLSTPDEPVSRRMPIVKGDWRFSEAFSFWDVCVLIRNTAFLNNNMPIIVNFTVHASPDQQQTMVDVMKEEWRGFLLDEPIDGCDPRFKLPRLEDLQNRILVKVSRPVEIRIVLKGTLPFDEPESSFLIQPLESLNVYLQSETFEGFESRQSKTPTHVFSWQENKLKELCSSSLGDVLTHSRHYVCRANPEPARADSSNLNPSLFWRYGVQMAAISHLIVDEGLMINSGIFEDEDGWVLKPLGYRNTNEDISNRIETTAIRIEKFSILVFKDQRIQFMTKDGTKQTKDLSLFAEAVMHSRGSIYHIARQNLARKDEDSEAFGYKLAISTITGIIPELTVIR
jgi:hypothetical protein